MKMMQFVLSALLIATVMVSCAPKSKKGAWIDADKEKFTTEFNKGAEGQEVPGLTEEQFKTFTKDLCDCAMKKAEANYENFDEANKDNAGMEKIGTECGTELAPKMLEMMMGNMPTEPVMDTAAVDTSAVVAE